MLYRQEFVYNLITSALITSETKIFIMWPEDMVFSIVIA